MNSRRLIVGVGPELHTTILLAKTSIEKGDEINLNLINSDDSI